jgi:hypothetical protein
MDIVPDKVQLFTARLFFQPEYNTALRYIALRLFRHCCLFGFNCAGESCLNGLKFLFPCVWFFLLLFFIVLLLSFPFDMLRLFLTGSFFIFRYIGATLGNQFLYKLIPCG